MYVGSQMKKVFFISLIKVLASEAVFTDLPKKKEIRVSSTGNKGKKGKRKRRLNYLRRQLRKQSMKTREHVPHLLPPFSLRPYVSLMLWFTTTTVTSLCTPASLPTHQCHTLSVLNGAIRAWIRWLFPQLFSTTTTWITIWIQEITRMVLPQISMACFFRHDRCIEEEKDKKEKCNIGGKSGSGFWKGGEV